MSLRLEGISKSFGPTTAVSRVSLELADNYPLALLGPSGCGKSTLLRLVAGLEQLDSGRVLLDDRDITSVPPQARGIGMVFQDYALFPHLNVTDNVGFALVEQGVSKERARRRVAELLDLMGLSELGGRRTYELSGGQQQRVALARALAVEPALLLLDEPLSNLDPELRSSLQFELRELLSGLDIQALYVTHDQPEAFTVAPRIALMRAGRLVQVGSPSELLERPTNAWAARFLGYRNLFPARRFRNHNDASRVVLIRDELIRPGGALPSRVEKLERSGPRLRLGLMVPEWGVQLSWEGYERELPEGLTVGDELGLEVPNEAFLELEEDATAQDSTREWTDDV